ncbi:histidine phosphatase family protein [Neptunomonas antarctica]|uniref:2,3-bisphosphoglycerate-dependent phosphoglycerate mutase n=2 Tax=Neptunomonas antarctica TaxID=619304 RepID=A0A1N7KHD1_9GAMM|nr:histidine phosphatase family protein [Neptunomonas antarctica]SIS61016.1 2,3-bisphosphoglycerate-dependent phosphoglycerate mutase [Neptunomonas antarctica]
MSTESNVCCALIRHGAYEQLPNVPSALQPYPLTREGTEEVRQQARAFGLWLRATGRTLDPLVETSTLLRAWQTGQIYMEELHEFFQAPPQLKSFPSLCERSVGAVANLSVSEIERVIELDPRFDTPPANWKSDSDYRLPFDGAESLMEAGERVAQHLLAWREGAESEMKSGMKSGIKLFVGHGAAIRHAAYHLNVIKRCDIKRLSMFYGHPVVFEMGLEFADGQCPRLLFGQWKQRQIQDVPD